MTPIIMVIAMFLGASWLFREDPWAKPILVWAAIGILGLFAVAYTYFAITDPDRLQSEKYQIDRRAQALEEQSKKVHEPADLVIVSNPQAEVEAPPRLLK